MPDQPIEPREHYVYALYREDGVTPFYIGMGKGDRWCNHETRSSYERQSPKRDIIRGILNLGMAVPKAKLAEGLTRRSAALLEIEIIARIGRTPDGPLVNRTSGGDGALGVSAETMTKRSESQRKAWADNPERRAKASEFHRTRVRGPRSAETKAKLSTAAKGQTYWKKIPAEKRAAILEHAHQMKKTAALQRRLDDPDYEKKQKIRQSEKSKKRYLENRESILAKQTYASKSPEQLERYREGARKRWAKIRQKTDPDQLIAESQGKNV